ncbi:NfuA family Fe-S biogenesis protein [Pseudomarimonas arenosa]|uniref:Fe/S biogenesis protein NfuA n=1 Tax=Pseudomarimonas arenosa TaxID=2774145 RepID=A0AAW3ZGI9_9GAMM|nr:NfuA family Fe-S biogenesis protein [Pseudomarimonas arenosa]MBD8524540.1 NfuA family Fe-S biogenesis protein [Pseudomarimonas arenosa]
MIQISESAQTYFRQLLDQQDENFVGIRLTALRAGTPGADARLEFCESADLQGDEWAVDCEGFTLFVDSASVPFFDQAEIDFEKSAGGGQVNVKAPKIKGVAPGEGSSLVERVRFVLDQEINPQLASHGGRVALQEVSAEGVVVLRFGGGCHGCGMVDVTLREGIETTLKQRVPEITAVVDATDHETGSNPYFQRQA